MLHHTDHRHPFTEGTPGSENQEGGIVSLGENFTFSATTDRNYHTAVTPTWHAQRAMFLYLSANLTMPRLLDLHHPKDPISRIPCLQRDLLSKGEEPSGSGKGGAQGQPCTSTSLSLPGLPASRNTSTLMKLLWKLPNTKTINMWPWKQAELKLSSEKWSFKSVLQVPAHLLISGKNSTVVDQNGKSFTMFKCWLQLHTGRSTVMCLLPLD